MDMTSEAIVASVASMCDIASIAASGAAAVDICGLTSLISTEVNVIGDMGDEAASATINTVDALQPLDKESTASPRPPPMTVGLNNRASAETDVAKTSAAVVTVLFLLVLQRIERMDR